LGIMVFLGTQAFVSDTETSTGNLFTAGAIDLLVDNTCHYNGKVCAKAGDSYLWEGTNEPCSCSWEATNLDGKALFSFLDVKPGDVGEQTISLHIDTNPAWVCAELSNINKLENGCNTPEASVDGSCEATSSGELWDNLFVSAWRDNGSGEHSCNNLKDDDENYLVENVQITSVRWPIADSTTGGEPIVDACIGVSWFVPSSVGNEIQTDSVTGNLTFQAYQVRNHPNYYCFNPSVTIVKSVTNDNGGEAQADDFDLFVGGTPVENSVAKEFAPGTYVVTESGPSGYSPIFGGDCDVQGNLTVSANEAYVCTVTNDDQPSTVKIVKTVVNDNGGTKSANDFSLKIDGIAIANDTPLAVLPGSHTASEDGLAGYSASAWGGDCAADGTVNVNLGENKTCIITNNDVQPKLTVTKTVVNNNGGSKTVANFPLFVGATPVVSGAQNGFNAGTYMVSETQQSGYAKTIGGDCAANGSITLLPGDVKSCTITNDDIQATLKLVKTVINDNGGSKGPNDFGLKIDSTSVLNNTPLNVNPGLHTASESQALLDSYGYTASAWGGDCAANGSVTVNLGENKTCTITNDDIPRQFVNGGFDSGSLSGWSTNGSSSTTTSYLADQGNGSYQGPTYYPRNGSYLGVVTAGLGTDVYTVISQDVYLTGNKTIAGYAAFDAIDYLPYNDDAVVTITRKGGSTVTPWSSNIQTVGSYGETPWQSWSYYFSSSGIYTIQLKVRNTGDNAVNSIAIFDYIRVQ
jgi:hypothetical protein